MRNRVLAVGALLLTPAALSAQDIPRLQDLRDCAAITRDSVRLACFDAVMREMPEAPPASRTPAAEPAATSEGQAATTGPVGDSQAQTPAATSEAAVPEPPAWQVRETRDPMTDQPTVFVRREAPDNPDTFITFRCSRNRTDMLIFPGVYVGADDNVSVMVRIDSRPATTQRWPLATTGRALFSPAPIEMAKALFNARELRVEINPRHGGRIQLRFDVDGLREAIAPLQAACNWR